MEGGIFTGERWEAYTQLLFLRARYYEPASGRFIRRDPLSGEIWAQRTLLGGYVYVRNSPVTLADPSGLVDCNPWHWSIRWMCERANEGDLIVTELLYYAISYYADFGKGGDFRLSGLMLRHFLSGEGSSLELPKIWADRLGKDPNIVAATDALLSAFVLNDVRSASPTSVPVFVGPILYRGLDFYTWEHRPKPQSPGLYGATGHFAVNGVFTARAQLCEDCRYLVSFDAFYSVDDSERYEWFKDKETDFGDLFGLGAVKVPHNWAISLRDATPPRAHEYTWSASWRDRAILIVEHDWSSWLRGDFIDRP